jgi:hypothetical protein
MCFKRSWGGSENEGLGQAGTRFACPSITALLSSTHLKKASPLYGRARLRLNPLGCQVVQDAESAASRPSDSVERSFSFAPPHLDGGREARARSAGRGGRVVGGSQGRRIAGEANP